MFKILQFRIELLQEIKCNDELIKKNNISLLFLSKINRFKVLKVMTSKN